MGSTRIVVMSKLARKVFDQTKIPKDLLWAWWVEIKLQKMSIGGLVKMINQSKRIDMKYIDGYMPKYKWSYREDQIDISKFAWLYTMIQSLGNDFNWGLWSELVLIKPEYCEIFYDAIEETVARNIDNLSYVLEIYKGQINKVVDQIINTITFDDIDVGQKTISSLSKEKWSNVKELL